MFTKKVLALIGLMLYGINAQSADNALGTYTFEYQIGDKQYSDVFVINRILGGGLYAGVDEYGDLIEAVKQGSQLCVNEPSSYIISQTWCTPIAKSTKKAFYEITYATGEGYYGYYYASGLTIMRVAGTPDDETYLRGERGGARARYFMVTYDPAT